MGGDDLTEYDVDDCGVADVESVLEIATSSLVAYRLEDVAHRRGSGGMGAVGGGGDGWGDDDGVGVHRCGEERSLHVLVFFFLFLFQSFDKNTKNEMRHVFFFFQRIRNKKLTN